MINEADKKIAIIGGGIAGMQAANVLGRFGYQVTIFEKDEQLGGNINSWNNLFPHNEQAFSVVNSLAQMIKAQANVKVASSTPIISLDTNENHIGVTTSDSTLDFDAAIVATGFKPFDASRKEEYGYGVYDRVITSVDFERLEKSSSLAAILNETSAKVGFVHCVGSRDEKVCNGYCSKVCCITAVKQAIEVKKLYPNIDVFCFYMDLRLFDKHFESIYREAQEKYGIQFIRGRMSEVNEDIDGKVIARVEDTLSKRPMKLTLDLLVLMVGMEPSEGTKAVAKSLNLPTSDDAFIGDSSQILQNQNTGIRSGVFVAGTAKGPSSVKETIADAKSVAINVHFYLKQMYQ